MSGGPDAPPPSPWRERLQQAPEWHRGPLLMGLLHEEIRGRLGLEPWEVTPRGPFAALGMTSLQATELKVQLEAQLGLPLRSSLAFDYPNLEVLVPFLLEQLGLGGRAPVSPSPPPTGETPAGAAPEASAAALVDALAAELADLAAVQRTRG